ncbi:odorant receptor 63a isoform X2 [Solenopsis invicta]|uniref:odorant receptor 63a isoform X2 n=1 Tax=Solenopsis invicta TaxID=13686 RepID=UPI00193E732B|nr:odorant receptor 63a isoform X2 [Solenopsis invicta]
MLVHVQREYKINKIFLSFLGIWPFQNKLARNLIPIFCLAYIISYYSLEIMMLYDHWKDTRLVFDCCYESVLITTCNAKLLNQFLLHDKIQHLYETINNHWNIFTNKSELQILKNYSNISRKFTIIYSIMICSMVTLFFLIPLTPVLLDIIRPLNDSRPRLFAMSLKLRIDQEKYYVPLYCYQYSITVLGAIVIACFDTTYVVKTAHACSLFSIINQQFEEILSKLEITKQVSKYNLDEDLELLSEKEIYQQYIICLKKYQFALEFVNLLNSTYQVVALFLLILNGMVISLVGIRIVYVLDQLQEVIRFSFVIVTMLIQLMIGCYSGQKLMDESQNIFYQIYAMKWYKFSPRLKSLLMITLYRSITPCSLTAGNMIPLSMTTYATVVRTALSYFTTFLSLKN